MVTGPEGWRLLQNLSQSYPKPVLPITPLSQPMSQTSDIISHSTLVLHVTQKTFVREFGGKICKEVTLGDLGIGVYFTSPHQTGSSLLEGILI